MHNANVLVCSQLHRSLCCMDISAITRKSPLPLLSDSHLQHCVPKADVRTKWFRLFTSLQGGTNHSWAHPNLEQQGCLLPEQLRPYLQESGPPIRVRERGGNERQIETVLLHKDRGFVAFGWHLFMKNIKTSRQGCGEVSLYVICKEKDVIHCNECTIYTEFLKVDDFMKIWYHSLSIWKLHFTSQLSFPIFTLHRTKQ